MLRIAPLVVASAILLSSGLVPACSSPPKKLLTSDGYLAVGDGTRPRKVDVLRPFVAEDAKLVVVRGRSRDPRHARFFEKWLEENGSFQEVWSMQRFHELARAREIQDAEQLLGTRPGLEYATSVFGRFLIVEPTVVRLDDAVYRATLDVTDSATGERLLHVVHGARNWTDIEEPLLHPLYNALVDWTHGVASDAR